jgi:hypothetical protein
LVKLGPHPLDIVCKYHEHTPWLSPSDAGLQDQAENSPAENTRLDE